VSSVFINIRNYWIPAFAGMTGTSLFDFLRDHLKEIQKNGNLTPERVLDEGNEKFNKNPEQYTKP